MSERVTEPSAAGARSGPESGSGDPAVSESGAAGPTLESLRERLAQFAAARDWGPFHTSKNLAAALSVEAGELLEIFQWLTPEQAASVMSDPDSAHRVRDEVADVLAYLLQFCTAVGVDPLTALAAKIERNELRFPVPEAARDVNPDVGDQPV
ncbi:nucleotide pyrophosphohydrolase [Kitasatospora sp. NPDC052868]|uniref:nucleotide pyrophosphohydrolase n=1 Tax=Kitasatospora sp. NPDC052868 TaxID=3364060 RepID=UPI0037C7F7D5